MKNLEDFSGYQQRRVWVLGVLSLLVLFLFLPLSAAFNWARFFPGGGNRVGAAATFFLYLPAFVGAIAFALLAPFLRAGFLVPLEKPARLLAAFFLWGLPLLSFAYWLGDFKTAFHAYEVGWLLFASVAIPLVLFWRTAEVGILYVGVGLIAFVPFFVVDDILGPFSPLWVFATQGPGVFFLRTACVSGALFLAAFGTLPKWGKDRGTLAMLRLGLVAMALASAGLQIAGWVGTADESIARYFSEMNWLGFAGLLYFLRRPDRFGKHSFVFLASLFAVSLVFQGVEIVRSLDESHWAQLRLFICLMGTGLVTVELFRRWRVYKKYRRYAPARAVPQTRSLLPT